jgi:toxin YoeB
MNLIFSDQAWEDYQFWQDTSKKTIRRIHELLKDIQRNPHTRSKLDEVRASIPKID